MSANIIDDYARSIITKLHHEIAFNEMMTGVKPKVLELTESDCRVLRGSIYSNLEYTRCYASEFDYVLGIKVKIVR